MIETYWTTRSLPKNTSKSGFKIDKYHTNDIKRTHSWPGMQSVKPVAIDELWSSCLQMHYLRCPRKTPNNKNHAMRTKSQHQVLTTFSSQCLNLCFEPWDNHELWAMDEITTSLGKLPSPNVACPLSVLQVLNMGGRSTVGYEGSLSRFGSGFSSHVGWIVRSVTHAMQWWVLSLFHPTKYDWC